MRAGRHAYTGGFTYVLVLAALAVFSLGLAALGENWQRVAQREKEQELLRVGQAYVQAIRSYYQRSPGSLKGYPPQLSDLLQDQRYIGTERHLRQLYRDPVMNSATWGLVKNEAGEVIGVYSLSLRPTLRRQPLALSGSRVLVGPRYCDWKFVYQP